MFTFPLFRPYFFLKGACFPHAQAVHLPVLRAVRVHHCIQPVLDGPAAPHSALPCRERNAALLGRRKPCCAGRAADGTAGALLTVTGIYTNLLPENDALRIKQGIRVHSELELDQLLEDLGE